jgi:hypothetical protein
MLWQPRRWSASIRSAISPGGHSAPAAFWLMSQFWQKTHRRLQRPKKMVPEPFQPRRQSSSPKWEKALATRAYRPVWQTRVSPASRLTRQLRGQAQQSSSSLSPAATRSASTPER